MPLRYRKVTVGVCAMDKKAKSKAMLYSFAKFKDVFDDWTVDETRVVNPNDGKWQAAAEVAQRVFFETKELEDGE